MKTIKKITQDQFLNFVSQYENASLIEHDTNFAIMINGIQIEIRRSNIALGYSAPSSAKSQIDEIIEKNGFALTEKQPTAYWVLQYPESDILDYFGTIIEAFDSEEIDFTRSSRRRYSGINRDGLFVNIATVIKSASDTQMYDMITRKVFDAVDDIVQWNDPLEEDSWREHVVPCTMIIEEAFRMYDEDFASVTDVAMMIQQNLFILHITKDQAHYLDYTLGLKTTMPDGWEFGDNPKARLIAAGITC